MRRQPVDKSVVKLWKERPECRKDWPLAIPLVAWRRTFLGRLHAACVPVK